MYGIDDLKSKIEITESSVECPHKSCSNRLMRQRGNFKRNHDFLCQTHGIYVSPSTFEYLRAEDNLLDASSPETGLLARIMGSKRESRMARDRSEDALTWNVFRYMDGKEILKAYFGEVFKDDSDIIEQVYWSYAIKAGIAWPELIRAREEFGESTALGSEPDLIIETVNAIYFIEAKYTSSNKTSGSRDDLAKRIANPKSYVNGGNGHFSKVFKSSYTKIVEDQKYELMRFWLLGSWIAQQKKKRFMLINIVRENTEVDIEHSFGIHINASELRNIRRITWESIGKYAVNENHHAPCELSDYLESRSIGYDGNGVLGKAFTERMW